MRERARAIGGRRVGGYTRPLSLSPSPKIIRRRKSSKKVKNAISNDILIVIKSNKSPAKGDNAKVKSNLRGNFRMDSPVLFQLFPRFSGLLENWSNFRGYIMVFNGLENY